MATTTPVKVHPKVKAAGQVAAALLALDAIITAVEGHIPSPAVVSVLALLHTVLPVLAGYLKSA